MDNQFALMVQRRFGPFFLAQFLGALNDNFFKMLVSVLIAYGLIDVGEQKPEMLLALATGLFVLPFIIFTPLAGDLTDKFDKSRVMRILKASEIIVVCAALLGLYFQSIPFLLCVIFALGAQSAFFSPGKFSIMPQHLARSELIAGNALVNTGTYMAVLFGTMMGSLLALSQVGLVIAGVILISCALIGYVASYFIPVAPPRAPDLKLSFNPILEAVRIIRYAKAQPRDVFPALVFASWFFFVGATYMTQFPNFTKQTLGVDHVVLTFFLATFSVGIAIGGLLNNTLLKSQVKATFVPLSALIISIFSFDLFIASQPYATIPEAFKETNLMGLSAFLSHLSGWRIIFDLLMVSVGGGLYAVPLKAIIQDRTSQDHCARVVAGSALMDALFVLLSAALAIFVFSLGFAVQDLFLIIAVVSLLVWFAIAHFMKSPLLGAALKPRRK